jgi:glycosyltransferase involved in cell wall biosynthesis
MMVLFNAMHVSTERMDGINRYSIEVLKRMDKKKTVFLANRKVIRKFGLRHAIVVPESLSSPGFKGNWKRLVYHLFDVPRIVREKHARVYYSPFQEGMPFANTRQVVTLHDLLTFHFPEVYPRLKYYFRWVLPLVLNSSARVIAVSEATKIDAEKIYRVRGKTVVIHNGCNFEVKKKITGKAAAKFRKGFGLERYVLFVSENRAYKNLKNAIIGFSRMKDPGLMLVVAGKTEGLNRDVVRLPGKLGITERVRFTGFVSDADLKGLYASAEVFLFPSFYEGFGFPPLEAMAMGCPVVASDRASIPEVCGKAAVYIDPDDPDSISGGLELVIGNKKKRAGLVRQGYLQVKKFDYRKAVEAIGREIFVPK